MRFSIITDIVIEPINFWANAFNAPIIWRGKNFQIPDLSQYDILLFYVIDLNKLPLVSEIRQKYPHLKVLVQTDSDFWWCVAPWLSPEKKEMKPEVLQGLKDAHAVLTLNPVTHLWYKELGINTKLDFFINKVPCYYPPIKSYGERMKDKKAIIMCHSMPSYKIKTNLQVAKRLGLKPIVIGTFQNEHILSTFVEEEGIKEYEAHINYMVDARAYYDKISECVIAFEDWYCGGSRFAIECFMAGVPVVGSENALSLKLISPENTCPNADIDCLVKKASAILNMKEREYIKLCRELKGKAKKYFSSEEAKNRLLKVIESL